jgi:hypothetical protein
MSTRILAIVLNSFLFSQMLAGQTTAPDSAGQQTPVIRTTRREVLVDLVVRDKHHRLVTNLKPEEVEVYEDGVLRSSLFWMFAGGEQFPSKAPQSRPAKLGVPAVGSEGTPPVALRQMNFVAIVIAMSLLNLQFAREAVRDFVSSGGEHVRLHLPIEPVSGAAVLPGQRPALQAVESATRASTDDGLGSQTAMIGAATRHCRRWR